MHSYPLWKQVLRKNFVSIHKLASFLELNADQQEFLTQRKSFPLNLPLRLAEKIQKGTLEDPILRQFVPIIEENQTSQAFIHDPVSDCSAMLSAKALQKYAGRVLLVTTQACAMHCRYCFRQHFDYAPQITGFTEELELIQNDTSIKEVILSGGDPLSLNNNSLQELILSLSAIPHIKRIRFHTRFPIGIPERIDQKLLEILSASTKQIWFVIHSNHPIELDDDVLNSLKKIQQLGIPLLNQSVLLKGVNDNSTTLQELSEKLMDHGILPYYLHQLDRVTGAGHFEVPPSDGLALIQTLTSRLSGYGVPKYVQEIPHMPSKTALDCTNLMNSCCKGDNS